MTRLLVLSFLLFSLASPAVAQVPSFANVPYGTHPRQVMDVYLAKAEAPTPLLFFVHGGGWMTGDKANPDFLAKSLENGISVVSINYRLITDATEAKMSPPVKSCLDDAARALQFVRSKAARMEDQQTSDRRAAAVQREGSPCCGWRFILRWADPKSSDPVARESTRLSCALGFVPQTTLDPQQMQAWIPNNEYGPHAFALPNIPEFLKQRETLLPWINRFSPYALASKDDPPVLLFYDNPPNLGQPYKDPPHSANYGAGIAPRLVELGIEHEINYNRDYHTLKYPDLFGFFMAKLTVAK